MSEHPHPEHPHHQHPPTGITDEVANEAHEFIEGAEEREHKAYPDNLIDRGHEGEQTTTATTTDTKKKVSKIDSIKEALHLKK